MSASGQILMALDNAQGPEIETMTSWLEAWDQDVPEGMSMEGMDHGAMDMGGMDAVETSQTQQAEGQDPQARDLAAAIEADQNAEIEEKAGPLPDAAARIRRLMGSGMASTALY